MEWPARRQRVHELVDEYYLTLYRYAYRLTGSAADAEDLTQEAFCKAQMRFHQLRDRTAAKPWLFAILRNEYLRAARYKEKTCLLEDTHAQRVPDESDEIDREALQRALSELPEGYRTPVILYYFEEFSYRQIADQMEVPIGTVMSRLSRAKDFLRQRLAPDMVPAHLREDQIYGL